MRDREGERWDREREDITTRGEEERGKGRLGRYKLREV